MKILGHGSAVVFLDDSATDRKVVEVCFRKAGYSNEMKLFSNHKELFQYLSDVENGITPMPEILMLDINMPEMDGFEVLRHIRMRPQFSEIPISFFLTSSSAVSDKEKAKTLGCKNFYTKPVRIENYIQVFEDIHSQLQ